MRLLGSVLQRSHWKIDQIQAVKNILRGGCTLGLKAASLSRPPAALSITVMLRGVWKFTPDLYLLFRKTSPSTHKVFAGLVCLPVILQLFLDCALNANRQLEECTVIMADRLRQREHKRKSIRPRGQDDRLLLSNRINWPPLTVLNAIR